jgi:hypothetical protein
MAFTDTIQGNNVSQGYEAFRKLYNTWLPQHRTSLQNITNRGIGG